jgi:TonB family protein
MNLKTIIFVLGVFLAQISCAYADSLKDALNHQYKKQVLALRTPFTHGDQKFDSTGKPLSHPESKWLLYGGLYVDKISLSSKQLRIEGRRVGLGTDKNNKPVLVPMSKGVRVEIELDQPLTSIDQAQNLLDRVFYPQTETDEHAKPELRRADRSAQQTIYQAGKDDVKYPKATYTPDPDFSERARRAKHQGTVILNIVVDEKGNVTRVRLDRALGDGLDENAMESVKDWRFSPATRNGQPVAVAMNVEVSFNLY